MEGDNEEGRKMERRWDCRKNIGWIIDVETLEEMLCHLGTYAYC